MKSKECIFCKIIQGTLPSEKVFENERVFAFRDISPQAPVHILIVPKKHYTDVLDVPREEGQVFSDLFCAAQQIAPQLGIAGPGFRTVFNSGDHACQTIYHVHLHLLGGTQMGGSMVG
ncbi:MAG: histidine triad nucleotide-binding protein [Deltaproteobacteria bacterium]|nr:histidine triad nucleotide-binding protein [Deltaproteobacteria bacterium]MBI3294751.1 histidine triad nucleotide-binding protein [Deltaproteobacteria bacterium]